MKAQVDREPDAGIATFAPATAHSSHPLTSTPPLTTAAPESAKDRLNVGVDLTREAADVGDVTALA